MSTTVEINLPQVQGPLVTVVKLIVSGELDVFTISLSKLVEQVTEAVLCPDSPLDMDDAGNCLVMCATLLRVKSRRLLPVQEKEVEEEIVLSEEEEEAIAIKHLAEYQHYQSVANMLEGLAEESAMLHPRGRLEIPDGEERETLSHVSLLSLVAALEHALSIRTPAAMEIGAEEYSLRAGLDHLRMSLAAGVPCQFLDVFPKQASRLVVVVVFLGLLELIRLGEIVVREHQGTILVCREGGTSAD